jgi:hypothetical protein
MSENNNDTPTVEVDLNAGNDESNSENTSASPEPKAVPEPKTTKKAVSFIIDVESKAIIETLVDSLEGFSMDNLVTLIPKLIKHVENYKNLTGSNKKALVIKMLNHIIDITDCPGDDDIFDPIMKRLVPGMIDLLVEVDSGKLKLKKKTCFSRFALGCMKAV